VTKEEILAMIAGEKLDRQVALYHFGYPVIEGSPSGKYEIGWSPSIGEDLKAIPLPPYSTDISAAWLVWLAVTKDAPEDWAIYSDSDGEVTVEHYPDDYKGDREQFCGDFSVDGLFPEAICKAALIAKLGVEGEN